MEPEKNIFKGFNNSETTSEVDLVCLSHLRWDFVYQRPQHLLSRFAKERRVFFFEEPVLTEGRMRLEVSERDCGVRVVVPHLPAELDGAEAREAVLKGMIDRLFAEHKINEHVLWYYTPMALGWSEHLKPAAVVYDCMDELSAFKGAPASLKERETELFKRADLVFTGGQSLYEAKRHLHKNIYPFPSSIDAQHFAQARRPAEDPADQAGLAHPRLGFFGVIDERMDIALLDAVAEARPDWHLVMVGPVVKIDEADLPRRPNIHYLGGKSYQELPAYLAGWDVALLPFALNESTRFISPTKTPEYLAAGRPVVSTSIRDVVRPYGELGLVHIADTPEEFITAIEAALNEADSDTRIRSVDTFLSQISWDQTWGRMAELIEDVVHERRASKVVQPALTARAAQAAAAASSTRSFVTGD
ncbi:MAG TPA: glycosyltransferase family 1 protein [Pyrinomonadaceae bacterium]|nr:glycosyltransferase family 1 protein [Pyrinomonadaceae bacterium]